MNRLEERVKTLADCYYNGIEAATDAEYDALVKTLKEKYPDSELLKKGVIGSDLKGINKKYKLPHCMNTLDKANSDEEFKIWWKKHPHSDLMTSLKIDGNSQLLHYENGKFVQSLSRGNGEEGEDTTSNISKINFPKQIDNFNGYIRGEVFMKKSVFEKHFSDGKNPRNQAAGIIKRLDGKDCDKLCFMAYEVFDDSGIEDITEENKFAFLEKAGFETPEHKLNITFDEIVEWKNKLDVNGEIPCDGIVIKQNQVDKEDSEKKVPLNNVAFKPNLQTATTKIKKIIWQLAGSVYSPVAEVDPVELEGTTVSRASLANVNIMNELGVYEGAEVVMAKAGLIIPTVKLVVSPKKNAFLIPTKCEVCGRDVRVNDSGFPECINPDCARKVSHRFNKLFKVFGIKGCGESFVKNLESNGITIKAFLNLCKSNDKKCLNKYTGNINGEKIFVQMNEIMKKEITPAQFLATFDIKLFDEKRINFIGGKTLDELLNITKEELLEVNGFSEITSDAFIEFMKNYKSEINDLRTYFTIKSSFVKIAENKPQGDKKMSSICFTGTCSKYKRAELTKLLTEKGYDVKDSVTKGLDILLCEDPNSGSSKLQKAAKNGTKVVSYDDFLGDLGL